MLNLVFVGDIHLGRRPTRLPEGLADNGLAAADLSPAAAWKATVEWARENKVDAVILAGDVIESLEDRFEAYGYLARGVGRLAEDGIEVVGVAGNHDVHALPRLADRVKGFHLLGRGGTWERHELEGKSGEVVDLLGWSFPKQRVTESPLGTLDISARSGVATLGVLHCDLDKSGSTYAPVRRSELESAPGDAWFLGHIHKPHALEVSRPIGYLGSLVGLDPGEPGARGPWHVCVEDARITSVEQLQLAPLRWERCDLDAADLTIPEGTDPDDAISQAISTAMGRIHERLRDNTGDLRAVGCRISITGRSSVFADLRGRADSAEFRRQIEDLDGVIYFVEKLIDGTAPAVDLTEIARSDDPPGLLARKLLTLEEDGDAAKGLVREATTQMAFASDAVMRSAAADATDEGDADAREILLSAGYESLNALLAQQATGEAGA